MYCILISSPILFLPEIWLGFREALKFLERSNLALSFESISDIFISKYTVMIEMCYLSHIEDLSFFTSISTFMVRSTFAAWCIRMINSFLSGDLTKADLNPSFTTWLQYRMIQMSVSSWQNCNSSISPTAT